MPRRKVLRHRFSVRYDQRVDLDNIPLGKGHHRRRGRIARNRCACTTPLADPRYIASHPDIRSEVAVPLIVQDRVVGVMDLESERIGFFTDDHVRMLALLAPQIASSVENARLYEELAAARAAHGSGPEGRAQAAVGAAAARGAGDRGPGNRRSGCGRRARSRGDIYDFFEHGDDYAVFAFGDVSGKGAAAALYGALVSGLLRTLAPRRRSPAELMQALNEVLLERKVDAQYVTLMVLLWESRDRQLRDGQCRRDAAA